MAQSSSGSANAPLQELLVTLEQATSMARQLPTTSDPTLFHQIYTTLHHAHHSLSTFLDASPFPALQPTRPSAENSPSSATGAADNDADPMQVGDGGGEEEPEENSRNTAIDMVEEGIRNVFIRNNKRSKRRLSPSATDEVALRDDGGGVRGDMGFDPLATRRRALDLVYQFHA